MAYDIVVYDSSRKQAVLELQKLHWGGDIDRNRLYFDWKYERNPWLTPPRIRLAYDRDKLIGMLGAYGSCWELGNLRHPPRCASLGDAVVDPKYRRQGIFQSLARALTADLRRDSFDYVISTSANHVTFRALSQLAHQASTRGPLLQARGWSRPWLWVANMLAKGTFGPKAGAVIERAPRIEEMTKLVARLTSDDRYRHCRDPEFYRWRFRNPSCRYRFLYICRPQLRGYLVVQEWDGGPQPKRMHNLVDWAAESDGVLVELLGTARRMISTRRFRVWHTGDDSRCAAALAANGFRLTTGEPRGPAVLISYLHDSNPFRRCFIDGRDPRDIANWDLRQIDSDFY